MALTERQAFVLDNLDRVSSDGARHEARYELDGQNVSSQVRSLLGRDMIDVGRSGALVRKAAETKTPQGGDPSVLNEMRALLLTETPPPRHRHPCHDGEMQRRST